MKRFLIGLLFTFTLLLASEVNATHCVPFSYYPTFSYPVTYSYRWHKAQIWRGRFFQAGYYRWDYFAGAWYRKGYGIDYGEFVPVATFIPVAAFVPQPVNFGTYVPPVASNASTGREASEPAYNANPAAGAAYGAGASGHAATHAPARENGVDLSPVLQAIERLNGRFETIEKRLDALERKTGTIPPATNGNEAPPPMPPAEDKPKVTSPGARSQGSAYQRDALAWAKARCAQCHTDGKLRDTTFTLLTADGQSFVRLTSRKLQQVAKNVAEGSMPPRSVGELPDSGKLAFSRWLNSLTRNGG